MVPHNVYEHIYRFVCGTCGQECSLDAGRGIRGHIYKFHREDYRSWISSFKTPQGNVVIKVCIDQGVNQKPLRRFQRERLIELRQANELEQIWSDVVVQQKKGFMLGHTRLGRDVLADEKIIRELERIIGPQNRIDIGHIYAAYLNKCEYFVTDNPDDFIKGGRKEALESLLGVKIRRTEEFIQEITTGEELTRG